MTAIPKRIVQCVLNRDGHRCVINAPGCVLNIEDTFDSWDNENGPKPSVVSTRRGLTLNQGLVDWRATVNGTRVCSVEGCEKPHYGRGFCRRHWERNHINGDPVVMRVLRGVSVADRLRHFSKRNGDCIEFTGHRDVDGYGHMKVNHKDVGAHRLSYMESFGPIPAGLLVRHKCDNPPCINPEHLELGTQWDNSQDEINRGRSLTGSRNPAAHLSEEDVVHIRSALASGRASRSLAVEYGVGDSTISRIKRGTHWRGIA